MNKSGVLTYTTSHFVCAFLLIGGKAFFYPATAPSNPLEEGYYNHSTGGFEDKSRISTFAQGEV